MNLKSGRNQVKAEPNMASISDLVFLLLIFFILLSTMIKPGIPVDPPSGETSVMDSNPTTVTIDKDNNYYVGMKKVTKESLVSELKKAFTKPGIKPAFILSVDKTVDSEHTVFVLDIANQNRWKVGIATKNN